MRAYPSQGGAGANPGPGLVWTEDSTSGETAQMTAQLASMPLFADLPEHARAMISRSAREVRYAPGDEIVREKTFSFEFFAISDGTATVLRGEERLAELGPGDF